MLCDGRIEINRGGSWKRGELPSAPLPLFLFLANNKTWNKRKKATRPNSNTTEDQMPSARKAGAHERLNT